MLKIICLFALFLTVGCIKTDNGKLLLDKVTNPELYNKRLMPGGNNTNEPLIVYVTSYVKAINFLDESKEMLQVEVIFRQFWEDSRLKFDSKNESEHVTLNEDLIWVPDVFFSNEHKGFFHNIMQPNMLIKINPSGKVLYSRRITLTLHCPMDLSSFPFDEQICTWNIESYAYQADFLVFKWKHGDNSFSVSKVNHAHMHKLESVSTSEGTVNVSTGRYSFIKGHFHFQRILHYYLINVFIPCNMLVMVSWTVFWINKNKLTARVLICVGALYFLANGISEINNELPKVSYTKSIDVFTGICLTFVFAVLLETITIHYLTTEQETEHDIESVKDTDKDKKPLFTKTWIFATAMKSHKLDIISRIAFPGVYLLFNIIYWSVSL